MLVLVLVEKNAIANLGEMNLLYVMMNQVTDPNEDNQTTLIQWTIVAKNMLKFCAELIAVLFSLQVFRTPLCRS